MRPRIGIILVHLNSYAHTRRCLESLAFVTYPNIDIIIVDNGSTDGSGKQLAAEFPQYHHIASAENNGFTGGNNIGITAALERGCEHCLLLNNDTIVTPSFLEPLVDRLLSDEHIAAVSGKIYYYPDAVGGKEKIIWYAGIFQKWHTGYHHIGVLEEDRGQFDVPMETIYASGCLMLMRGEVIRKIGMLLNEYFIYWEESDWCLRAKENGYSSWYEPASVIYHNFTNASFGQEKPFYMYMQMRNSFIFAAKHFRGMLRLRRILFYPIYIFYYFCMLLRHRNTKAAIAIWHGIVDYFRGYRGIENAAKRGYIKLPTP